MSIKITGIRQALSALNRTGQTTNAQLATATKIAAVNVDREAKKRTPVDTGRLRSSINFEVDGITGEVRTDVEYAPFVEFGTGRMQARPFLFPAWEAERPKYIERVKAILRQL